MKERRRKLYPSEYSDFSRPSEIFKKNKIGALTPRALHNRVPLDVNEPPNTDRPHLKNVNITDLGRLTQSFTPFQGNLTHLHSPLEKVRLDSQEKNSHPQQTKNSNN